MSKSFASRLPIDWCQLQQPILSMILPVMPCLCTRVGFHRG